MNLRMSLLTLNYNLTEEEMEWLLDAAYYWWGCDEIPYAMQKYKIIEDKCAISNFTNLENSNAKTPRKEHTHQEDRS